MTEFPIKYTKDGGVVVGQGYADEAPQRAVPTQTEFPLKAVLRTIVAYLVGLALTALAGVLVGFMPGVEGVLDQLEAPLIEAITQAVAIGIAGLITWLMAKPKVNAFLTQLGLGATPSRAV